jgi:hypothetical protein
LGNMPHAPLPLLYTKYKLKKQAISLIKTKK